MLSDRSLKENIEPITDIATLLELMPVQFTMKGGTKRQFGFIAQDLEKTNFKNLVYNNTNSLKSVAYVQLIAVLTKHVQDLTKRVEELESIKNKRNPEFPA
jgi:hypothetical protein